MNKKTIKKVFMLNDENGELFVKLEAPEGEGMEMTVHGVPNIKVRAPRPSNDTLFYMAQIGAIDPSFSSDVAYLEDYAKEMNEKIIEQLQEIRKSIKRIQGFKYCARAAEKVIVEIEQEK